MHELEKIESSELRSIYGEIRGDDEPPGKHGLWVACLQTAARFGGECFAGVVTLLVLGAMAACGVEMPLPYVIVAGFGIALVMVLKRGKHAETGKRRSKEPALPGAARASPRKARASPGSDRGRQPDRSHSAGSDRVRHAAHRNRKGGR